ncbi:hypothetical protein ACFVMC_14940 [Nocardia sp. NPDC127579]|uniref:PaaI family thioesterase n=1 Tax=Nocardia sp. NPDC127579 TaxID=3345402 RepID=UPI00363E7277
MGEATVKVPGYAHGYPGVAFGGYVAGVLAAHSAEPAELRVDFRAPVPIDTELTVRADEADARVLSDADGLVLARTAKASVTIAVPPMPSWAQAQAATEATRTGARRRTNCYGCGVETEPGRGMRLFTSQVPGRDLIAGAWTPDPLLGRADGTLAPEQVWSLLDCPGGWAAMTMLDMPAGAVTAALTATQLRPVSVGADYLSFAWTAGRDGRKFTVGVALATPDGELCALSEALWIAPRGS